MRTVRNLSFVALILLVYMSMSRTARAYEIIGDPTCNEGQQSTTFTAYEASCAEVESECAEACWTCYDRPVDFVIVDECGPGTSVHYAVCYCYFY